MTQKADALAVRGELVDDRPAPPANVALFPGDPSEVVAQAVKVADALKAVVEQKGLVKRIQGREFVEVAGWQTLGAMTRVTPFCEWSHPIGDDFGWEARVVVKNSAGIEIGAAEAQCTRDERTWAKRDSYALRSMAQTRATSKALRMVLGFIVVLAGYTDTPSDEMPNQDDSGAKHATAHNAELERQRRVYEGITAIKLLCEERVLEVPPDLESKTLPELRQIYRELLDARPWDDAIQEEIPL